MTVCPIPESDYLPDATDHNRLWLTIKATMFWTHVWGGEENNLLWENGDLITRLRLLERGLPC